MTLSVVGVTGGKVWLVIFATLTIPPTPLCLNYISNMMVNIFAMPFGIKPHTDATVSRTTRMVILLAGLLMHLLVCGGLAFSQIEDWGYGDSVYYSFVTLTTIGLGDFAPATQAGQWWSIFFVLFGLGIVSLLIEDLIALFQQSPQVEGDISAPPTQPKTTPAITQNALAEPAVDEQQL